MTDKIVKGLKDALAAAQADRAYGVEFIGPFVPEHRVVCDGFAVPYLTVHPREDGTVRLCLDGRFLIEATGEEARKWIWFIANAMAVSAGYSCFGDNSVKDPNPFQVRAMLASRPQEPS